jgi:arsenite methyltransferase
MRPVLLDKLADPIRHDRLSLDDSSIHAEEILNGSLIASDGTKYPILQGIPRFVLTEDLGQLQTSDSFAYKWKQRNTYDSPEFKNLLIPWMVEKYGFFSLEDQASFYSKRESILDIGCGSGLSSSLWLDTPWWNGHAMWVGVDISTSVDVAQERLATFSNTHFVQGDALYLPFSDGSFDTIFSEGVLHHTPSTKQALFEAARVLAPGGEIHFYVYRRKGPVREFTDDYIREAVSDMTNEEAWDAMRSLTHLGKVLSETESNIELEQDIPLLGINAGKHNVQRLIYWNFAKLYWNADLSFEENVHVNFDWYRPLYAHRQTAEEIRAWCDELELNITWFHEQESGYTVRALRSG